MADIAVFVTTLNFTDGGIHIVGEASVSSDATLRIPWEATAPWPSSATAVNQAAVDAAVASAALLGVTVGGSDNKLVFAGAQQP
jgi:hypothetical protein